MCISLLLYQSSFGLIIQSCFSLNDMEQFATVLSNRGFTFQRMFLIECHDFEQNYPVPFSTLADLLPAFPVPQKEAQGNCSSGVQRYSEHGGSLLRCQGDLYGTCLILVKLSNLVVILCREGVLLVHYTLCEEALLVNF